MNTRRRLTAALALLLSTGLAALPVFPSGSAARSSRGGRAPAAATHAPQTGAPAAADHVGEAARADFGRLPLEFEANHGQAEGRVDFITRTGGATVFLTPAEAVFVLSAPDEREGAAGASRRASEDGDTPAPRRTHTLRMKVEGAREAARAEGLDRLPGIVNYFIGNDPADWRTEIPTFARVRYPEVYEGIDLVYYGTPGRQLEYDFVVAPGADAARVALSF